MKRNLAKVCQLYHTLPRTSQESGLLVNYDFQENVKCSFKENRKLLKSNQKAIQHCGNESLGGKKSLKIQTMTVICQQVEHVTFLLITVKPAELWECLHFRPRPVSWIKTGSAGRSCKRRVVTQFRLGARKDTAVVLGGTGGVQKDMSGEAGRVSDAILLPEDKRRHAVSSSPSTFSSLSPCMYRPSTS